MTALVYCPEQIMENGDAVNKIFGYDSILNQEPNTIFDFCANNTFV